MAGLATALLTKTNPLALAILGLLVAALLIAVLARTINAWTPRYLSQSPDSETAIEIKSARRLGRTRWFEVSGSTEGGPRILSVHASRMEFARLLEMTTAPPAQPPQV